MTTGPLRGLAARALGLEQALRGLRLPTFAEAVAVEPPLARAMVAVMPLHLAPDAESLPHAATAGRLGTVAEVPEIAPATAVDAAPPSLAEPPAQRPARHAAAGLAAVAPPRHAPVSTENEFAASAATTAGGHVQPSTDTTERLPPPLMPLQTMPALPRASPRAGHRDTPSARPRPAAESVPTEVHVSIGRVELIAAPPRPAAAPGRSAARRDDVDSRSLAAYLRGDVRSVR